MPWAKGCAGTSSHNCLLQRMQHCYWRAGRCLTLSAQVPSHPPPQGPARIYCFPCVQGSVHSRLASSYRCAPQHCCILSPSPKALTRAWGLQLLRTALRDSWGLKPHETAFWYQNTVYYQQKIGSIVFSKIHTREDIRLSLLSPAPPHVLGTAKKPRFLQTHRQVSAPREQPLNNCLLSACRGFNCLEFLWSAPS